MGKHGLPATQLSNIANTFKFVGKATYRAKKHKNCLERTAKWAPWWVGGRLNLLKMFKEGDWQIN